MAASKARFRTVAGSPFFACACVFGPAGRACEGWAPPLQRRVPHHPDRRHPSGRRRPRRWRRGTRAGGASPSPRACAAAGCRTPSPPVHAVAVRCVIRVGARPQGASPFRRAGDPRSGSAVEVGPPPGRAMAPQLPHARHGGQKGWGCWCIYALSFVAPVRSGGRRRRRVRPLVGSCAGPRLLLSPTATGSQAVVAGSVSGGRGSLDWRNVSANGAPCGVAATAARPPPPSRLATRRRRSRGEEARGGGCRPRRQSGRECFPAPWRGAGNGSGRACRGRVLACCRGMPCVSLIAMTLDRS